MMQIQRTQMLIGKQAIEKIQNSCIAVFGLGGVGGYAVEALARSGISKIDLFDFDVIEASNINRQIIATHSNIGELKTIVSKKRILDINPKCSVNAFNVFYDETNYKKFPLNKYDYIIDAIDTVNSKILLIENAKLHNVPIISAMGAGNKIDATSFEVSDIKKTHTCPLAKIVRKKLKEKNIEHLKVVFSKEKAIIPKEASEPMTTGSMPYMPGIMGLIIASEVIKDLMQ